MYAREAPGIKHQSSPTTEQRRYDPLRVLLQSRTNLGPSFYSTSLDKKIVNCSAPLELDKIHQTCKVVRSRLRCWNDQYSSCTAKPRSLKELRASLHSTGLEGKCNDCPRPLAADRTEHPRDGRSRPGCWNGYCSLSRMAKPMSTTRLCAFLSSTSGERRQTDHPQCCGLDNTVAEELIPPKIQPNAPTLKINYKPKPEAESGKIEE